MAPGVGDLLAAQLSVDAGPCAGGLCLPAGAGELIVQGENLGARVGAQRVEWERLMPAQQRLLKTLGIEPPAEDEVLVPVR